MKCSSCGTEIAVGLSTCPGCGSTRPQLPPQFTQIERQYTTLHQAYQGSRLDLPTFQAELSRLAVKDAGGVYWTIGVSGQWYWYSKTGWVAGSPPAEQAAAPVSSAWRNWT